MAGFASYDALIAALTSGLGQRLTWNKSSLGSTVAQTSYDLFYAGGIPVAGAFGTALTGRVMTDADTGGMPYSNPTGPATLHAVSAGLGSTTTLGTIMLYDRLVEYPFNGTVTSGSFNSGTGIAPPARDVNGAASGAGVQIFVESVAATGGAAQTLTLTYTNQAGTGSKTTALALKAGTAIAGDIRNPAGQTFQCALSSGDSGVKSIQSYTLGATVTSTQMNVVLYRPLCYLPVLASNAYVERDLVLQLASLPRIYDDSCLGLALLAGTTSSPCFGQIQLAEG